MNYDDALFAVVQCESATELDEVGYNSLMRQFKQTTISTYHIVVLQVRKFKRITPIQIWIKS